MYNFQAKGFFYLVNRTALWKPVYRLYLSPFHEWQNTNKTIHGNFPLFLDLATYAHDFKIGVQVFKLNGVMPLAMYNVCLSQNSVFKNKFFALYKWVQ